MSLEVSLDGFSSPLLGCHADNHQDKYQTQTYNQSDHSADNVKIPWQFHDISPTVRGTPAHAECYSHHAGTSVIVSGGVRMQQRTIRNQNETLKFSKVKNGCKYAANNKQF